MVQRDARPPIPRSGRPPAEPTAEHGEVIVAVEACGVCGSDLHFLDGTARTDHTPITLGHEIAGTVARSRDPAWRTGDPVVVRSGWFCGSCPRCHQGRENLCRRSRVFGIDVDGGLADLIATPAGALVGRPAGVTPAAAATAVDAGATAYHAVTRRAGVSPGDAVLIIGAGGLGTYGVQFARKAGATPLIVADTDPVALDRAMTLGADEVVRMESGKSLGRSVKMLTEGGADIAIEFVGRAAIVDAAVKSLRPGGRAVAVGVGIEPLTTVPPVLWSNNEYTLTGSYGSLPGDTELVLEALAAGEVLAPPTTPIALDTAAGQIMRIARGDVSGQGRLIVTP